MIVRFLNWLLMPFGYRLNRLSKYRLSRAYLDATGLNYNVPRKRAFFGLLHESDTAYADRLSYLLRYGHLPE